jgi:hypothetical protein
MIDVLFPKRAPAARERDTRPVPSEYRPKALRAGVTEGDGFFGAEPESRPDSLLDSAGINLTRFEDELNRSRLDEIATLVRALTYGEMMELAQAIWKIRPDGTIDQQSLPMMLHLWSTSIDAAKDAEAKAAEQ